MNAVLDVHYHKQVAHAACIEFLNWNDRVPARTIVVSTEVPSVYRPGRFFERELPCLIAVLERAGRHYESLIIDGYVFLDSPTVKGLGAHLEQALPYSPTVIGVAKNPLRLADRFVTITRGKSKKPLFISSVNMPVKKAAELVAGMDGPFRIPTLIRLADKTSRGGTGDKKTSSFR
jgi:deoxyribonuclease V